MKKYLKNREGMALPMVLIIMTVLTILAAGLGTYASQALRSVKYMDAQKQAYYLARAGVEAGSFAYQNASTKTSNSYNNMDNFKNGLVGFTTIDKLVTVVHDSDEVVTSNKVYLVYDDTAANEGTMWDGLKFATYSSDEVAKQSAGVIGYFSLEVAGAQDEVIVKDDNGNDTTVLTDVVEFRSTAVCFNDDGDEVTRVSTGYVYPAEQISSETCYGADGYLSTDSADFDNVDPKTVRYDSINTQDGPWWKRLNNGLIKLIFDIGVGLGVIPSEENIMVYEKIGGGDLVFARPSEDVGELKINKNENNFYIFSTSGAIILEDTGLSVDPSKGTYATIGLYGSDIVVDGDITMGVYHARTSGILNATEQIVNTLGNRYRLGTVMIGNGVTSGGEFSEYLSYSQGGITDQNGNKLDNASRIFFNGNVNVKIYSQGGSTETYRVFSAGDICLFNGVYEVTNDNLDGKEVATRGIDLLKYFLDAVIAKEDGYLLGESAIKKMTEIRDIYYGDPADSGEPSYFEGNTRAIRKLDVNFGSTEVTIDGKSLLYTVGSKQLIEYIQQPTPTQSSNINWGTPSVSRFAN